MHEIAFSGWNPAELIRFVCASIMALILCGAAVWAPRFDRDSVRPERNRPRDSDPEDSARR